MNRRNVLGHQIEASKTTWIVLSGLTVSALQFALYYLTDSNWLCLLLSGVAILLGGIIVHVITGELEELFAYLLIPCVCSGAAGILIPRMESTLLPDSNMMFVGCLLAWLLPVIYACLYTWAEGNIAMGQFSGFYKKAVIFFYLIYFVLLCYWYAVYKRIPEESVKVQLIPFATFAAYLDGIMSDTVPTVRLLEYLAERIILFIPYGFFIAMVCSKFHGLFRFLLILLLPVAIEVLQYILKFNSCNADEIIFSFVGALIGMLIFIVFNVLFRKIVGKNFDGSEIDRDYYGRKI